MEAICLLNWLLKFLVEVLMCSPWVKRETVFKLLLASLARKSKLFNAFNYSLQVDYSILLPNNAFSIKTMHQLCSFFPSSTAMLFTTSKKNKLWMCAPL